MKSKKKKLWCLKMLIRNARNKNKKRTCENEDMKGKQFYILNQNEEDLSKLKGKSDRKTNECRKGMKRNYNVMYI